MRGKRRPKGKATALALVLAAAGLCALPAVAAADPGAPTGLSIAPTSPANNNLPVLTGTADAGSTVSVFDNGDCTGSLLGTVDAATFGGAGFDLSVNDDTTTTYSANATDVDGTGPCSGPVSYVEDSSGPSTTGLTTNPTSPADNNDPLLKGTTEAGSTVAVYANGSCSSTPSSTGPAGTFTSTGLSVHVNDDTTNSLSARATDAIGNAGPCSSSISYVEDSTPPAAPSGLTTNPGSPSNDNTPLLKGTAAAGSVSVAVYANATCSLAPSDTGTPDDFSSPGLEVTVPSNQPTAISANSTDAAGNVGGCTSINYVEDSTPPPAPTGLTTTPASPSNNNNPFLKGNAGGDSASVSVYISADCTGTAVSGSPVSPATFASTGVQVNVPSNAPTALSARATDGVGNVGACATITYVEDSTGPAAPTGLSTLPVSPANDNDPLLRGTVAGDTFTVKVFANGTCSGTPPAQSPATFTSPGLPVHVNDNVTTSLSAQATDAVGNVGPCSSPINYEEDSTLPMAPTALATAPTSGSNNNDPIFKGTSSTTGTTVAVYTNGTCSGHAFNGGSAAAFAAAGFSFHVADNTITHLSARSTDVALNQSACSSPLDYAEVTPGPPAGGVAGTTVKKCKKKSKSKSKSASTAKKKKSKKCKKKKKKKN